MSYLALSNVQDNKLVNKCSRWESSGYLFGLGVLLNIWNGRNTVNQSSLVAFKVDMKTVMTGCIGIRHKILSFLSSYIKSIIKHCLILWFERSLSEDCFTIHILIAILCCWSWLDISGDNLKTPEWEQREHATAVPSMFSSELRQGGRLECCFCLCLSFCVCCYQDSRTHQHTAETSRTNLNSGANSLLYILVHVHFVVTGGREK